METKSRASSFRILIKSAVWAFAIVGLLAILLLFSLVSLVKSEMGSKAAKLPDRFVLAVNLDAEYSEVRGDSLLHELAEVKGFSFYDLTKSLKNAAQDTRVAAIYLKVGETGLGLAQIQEIRKLLALFKASGKNIYAYSSSFGHLGAGNDEYYLVSQADKIVLMPGGELGLTGLSVEIPFAKGLLDKIGVTPEFYARYEYKNAYASFTEAEMPKEMRRDFTKLADNLWRQIIQDVAEDRNIKEAALQKLADKAPLVCREALENGLVDDCGSEEDFAFSFLKELDAEMVPLEAYAAQPVLAKDKIALLSMEGVIDSGLSSANPLGGDAVIGAESVKAQLDDLKSLENLKAVVIRINSPGGDSAAAKEMWQALMAFKQREAVPVLISMGNYAASGGYFIALAGDRIYADEATVTGSVGVVGGKPVLEKLWKKLGVNWSAVNTGKNAGISSINRDFSLNEKQLFNKILDNIYSDFTLIVSQQRHLTLQEVDKLARGRVWLGDEAVKNGLADALGGLNDVLEAAGSDKAEIVYYPKAKTFTEKLQDVLGGSQDLAINQLKNNFAVEFGSVNMLNRLNYNLILWPFVIR